MADAWPYPMDIDPRLLELNRTGSYNHNTATQIVPSNETQYGGDSWPNIPASTGSFIPDPLAGPHLAIGFFDADMSAVGGDFQLIGAQGSLTKCNCRASRY